MKKLLIEIRLTLAQQLLFFIVFWLAPKGHKETYLMQAVVGLVFCNEDIQSEMLDEMEALARRRDWAFNRSDYQ